MSSVPPYWNRGSSHSWRKDPPPPPHSLNTFYCLCQKCWYFWPASFWAWTLSELVAENTEVSEKRCVSNFRAEDADSTHPSTPRSSEFSSPFRHFNQNFEHIYTLSRPRSCLAHLISLHLIFLINQIITFFLFNIFSKGDTRLSCKPKQVSS
jgi:hypothetical protein